MLLIDEDVPVRPSDGVLMVHDVDHRYIPLLDIEIVQGSNFTSVEPDAERIPILLNEAAVIDMQMTDPLRQLLQLSSQDTSQYEVVGIVSDFHFRSARSQIRPLMIRQIENAHANILIKLPADNIHASLSTLEDTWKGIGHGAPCTYRFLDDHFEQLYDDERRTGTLFGLAASLAIIVSCLGLFGLAAFSVEQRRKEIGIRKVMGASISAIISLVSREFLIIVAIAFIIAAPIAWYIMDDWLSSFAYRIEMGSGILMITATASVSIALVTVGFQAFRAALSNPADTLRAD